MVDINSFSCVKAASAKFIVDQNGIKTLGNSIWRT